MSTVSPSRYVPYGFARTHQVLVAGATQDAIEVWIGQSTPAAAIAELSRTLPLRLITVRKPDNELMAAISRAYSSQEGSAAAVADEVASDLDLSRLMQDIPKIEDLLETEDDAPIIRMINALLTQASRDGASDIHIEPFEGYSLVRFRVDGTLRDVVRPRREIHAALISRIKIMAQLDIAEKRLPQDGRITLRIGGRPVDVRVSTLPTGHGERAVLRLLDKEAGRLDLEKLGMSPRNRQRFDKLIHQPHGIVLVTGPTGSGKTTTLYAALGQLDSTMTNILTVEDPIEYDLDGIGQIAVQSSLTGHLVLATLHTNDSVAAITRLIDMGIEPFLLSSSLLGALAQRLVRKLCPQCREPDPVTGHWKAVGCAACNKSGYQGRTGVHELMLIDDDIRSLIHQGQPESEIRAAALRNGFMPMREDGQRWVEAGVTSPDEVIRVTRD